MKPFKNAVVAMLTTSASVAAGPFKFAAAVAGMAPSSWSAQNWNQAYVAPPMSQRIWTPVADKRQQHLPTGPLLAPRSTIVSTSSNPRLRRQPSANPSARGTVRETARDSETEEETERDIVVRAEIHEQKRRRRRDGSRSQNRPKNQPKRRKSKKSGTPIFVEIDNAVNNIVSGPNSISSAAPTSNLVHPTGNAITYTSVGGTSHMGGSITPQWSSMTPHSQGQSKESFGAPASPTSAGAFWRFAGQRTKSRYQPSETLAIPIDFEFQPGSESYTLFDAYNA